MENMKIYGSVQVAERLNMNVGNLWVWLQRNPEYKPAARFSGNDMLWTEADIERVRQARERTAKHGNRRARQVAKTTS